MQAFWTISLTSHSSERLVQSLSGKLFVLVEVAGISVDTTIRFCALICFDASNQFDVVRCLFMMDSFPESWVFMKL